MAWLQAAGRGGTVGIRGLGGGGRGGWVRGNGYGLGRRARRSKARISEMQASVSARDGTAKRRVVATQRNVTQPLQRAAKMAEWQCRQTAVAARSRWTNFGIVDVDVFVVAATQLCSYAKRTRHLSPPLPLRHTTAELASQK